MEAIRVRIEQGLTRICCGSLIEPRLAEIRDRFGQTLFAAVCRCPTCGQVTY
ncbi:MAG: hypothetical protein ACE5JX_01840 [Acidobacteriota bacterium]